ncbi:putative protein kinase RLK-Pelle-L-LEC family [Helianthus annuus]|nr:putative protein kinase RLK-Pelle-L-LEC family [Helianthus annuus]
MDDDDFSCCVRHEGSTFDNLTLASSQQIRAWVDYDGVNKQLHVTLAPLHVGKPKKPLASIQKDLSTYLLDEMFVGFTSATVVLLQRFYVQAWSFQVNDKAQEFNVSNIPPLPLPLKKNTTKKTPDDSSNWVYKGILPELGTLVAVKKVWHESGRGMKEFMAEIATIGRPRHPNLVRLLGYCRRKGELFLVYDYMPKLSLDSLLHTAAIKSSLSIDRCKGIRE